MMLPNAYFTLGLVRLDLGVSSPKKDVRAQLRHLKADRSFSQHTVCNILQPHADSKRFEHIPNTWQTSACCGSKDDEVLVLQ